MSVSATRNPNLSAPEWLTSVKGPRRSFEENLVQKKFGQAWWTGTTPENTPGFDLDKQSLHALPLLNLKICTRQDVLDYFNNTWTLTELLFAGIKNEQTFFRAPYHQLRHPLIFYYGHTAVLYLNKMRLAGLIQQPVDLYLEKILETGVDEMSWDDMSKNEMLWPSVEKVKEYRQKIYGIVKNIIQTHPDLGEAQIKSGETRFINDMEFVKRRGPDSPLWSLFMGFEHEKIHFETSSVLIRELPIELVETPRYWPQMHVTAYEKTTATPVEGKDFAKINWTHADAREVSYGKPLTAASFGWDNEYGHRKTQVKDFQFTALITNGQYCEFVRSLAYVEDRYWTEEGLQWRKFRNTKRPTFWVAYGPEGLHDYKLRTIFEIIDMPWCWPVEVNYHEAKAFALWKQNVDTLAGNNNDQLKYRMLTEPEHVSLRQNLSWTKNNEEDPVLQNKPFSEDQLLKWQNNFNFQISSPRPVTNDASDLFGNVWQWAEDQFNPLENFKVHPLYDDFSTPCFDGKHQMILGGSFISCGHEASQWARFHFRPHFFQHAGFRLAATLDGSDSNAETLILKNKKYIHPRRSNTLDQMKYKQWWTSVSQPLEIEEKQLKELWQEALEAIVVFETKRNHLPVSGTALDFVTNELKKDFSVPYQKTQDFPSGAEFSVAQFSKLIDLVAKDLSLLGQFPGHKGYMAYVAGAANPISQIAQALAQAMNQFTGHRSLSPGLVEVEKEALGWIKNLFGCPQAEAFFTSGGSLATLSALSFARNQKLKGSDLSLARFYSSELSHHCIAKSLAVLGFPVASLVRVPTDAEGKIKIESLKDSIEQDLKNNKQPVCVIGTAGTTNCGSVDSLDQIANLCRQFNMWFHVDAAYGGFFLLTEKGRSVLSGIQKADSIVLDPHKSFSMPYGLGCLIVKDPKAIEYTYHAKTSYMPPQTTTSQEKDFADLTPELSRDYRGLRFWLPLKYFGVEPFVLNLEEKLKLAEYVQGQLSQMKQIETLPCDLSIVAFRLNSDEETKNLLVKINQQQSFYLTSCQIQGKLYIRVCLLGFRTHYADVQQLLEDIRNSI